jgi:hypothetical protein
MRANLAPIFLYLRLGMECPISQFKRPLIIEKVEKEGDMKGKILFGCSLLAIVALVSIGRAPSAIGQAGAAKAAEEQLITVLNPAIAGKMAERVPLVPRLDSLEGKTIYMVDIQWGGPEAAYSVFEEMQAWFSRNMPSVKTVIRRTSGSMFTEDTGLTKEIAAKKVDAVIVGIAG